MKTCTKCGVEKPREMFGKNKSRPDGLHGRCKACACICAREHYEANKVKILARHNKYREIHKNEIHVQRKANKEKTAIASKKYYEANRKAIADYFKKYRKNNPEKGAAQKSRYKAQKLQAVPAWYEKTEVALIYAKAQEWGMHVDHIIPLQSKTVCGLHCHSNLQLLDGSLNSSKGNRYEATQ